jgi:hypothetical protein
MIKSIRRTMRSRKIGIRADPEKQKQQEEEEHEEQEKQDEREEQEGQ